MHASLPRRLAGFRISKGKQSTFKPLIRHFGRIHPEPDGRFSFIALTASKIHKTRLRRSKGMVLDPEDGDSVSAGSFFVNPVLTASEFAALEARAGVRPPAFAGPSGSQKVAAAWLVEQAGFPKGWGQGSVGVSRKHALSLVNRGGASSRDLLALARQIREGVSARFGVDLEPEPVFVGCSWPEGRL